MREQFEAKTPHIESSPWIDADAIRAKIRIGGFRAWVIPNTFAEAVAGGGKHRVGPFVIVNCRTDLLHIVFARGASNRLARP